MSKFLNQRMCKTKMSTAAAQPKPRTPAARDRDRDREPSSTSSGGGYTSTSSSGFKLSSGANSLSSRTSLSSLRDSLPENPHIYHFSEIRAATNNFLAKRYNRNSSSSSSSSSSWRCVLRGKDAIVFQRKFRGRTMEVSELKDRLSVICRSHHTSVVKLLGASVSGDHIYLVYDFVAGASLADCLRNPRSPDFTVLSTWISRIRIAADLAHGLDYIHNKTGLAAEFVHNRIRSSAVVVSEEDSGFRARLCHFGAAQLCGETEDPDTRQAEEVFEGAMGYMSPEFKATGAPTREADVYAFGVVILELISGDEAVKFRMDRNRGEFVKTAVVDSAAAASAAGSGGLRRWVDPRLRDSFPVEVVERLIRVALECVHVEASKRPNMGRVAGKVSKLYLESQTWADSVRPPTEISVSLAPR